MTYRAHNFGAGPAALPLPVLERVQSELLDFQGSGMSILEVSHRGAHYDRVHQQTLADLRTLLVLGDDHDILFMGGGACLQFSLVPMNLLAAGQRADYLITGSWSQQALAEASKVGTTRALWSSAESGFDRVPGPGDYQPDPEAAYLHYTSNNTIAGTQYPRPPEAGTVPLVCDMSSDILSRPMDFAAFGLIYAGAQKNLGPAGVTLVVIRRDLLQRSPANLGKLLSYAQVAAKSSLLNTPPVFAVYVVGLVARHLLDTGGLEAAAERNERKARLLYDVLDASGGFFRGHAQAKSRSLMNVTFRLPTPELEARFVQEATTQGLVGLKGHRSVGGLRASIYNAVSLESVQVLADFMKDFQRRVG